MWGERCAVHAEHDSERTMPTHVENCSEPLPIPAQTGPSPHTWGERTPSSRLQSGHTDHPHVCGESCVSRSMFGCVQGPSPHRGGEQYELLQPGVCRMDDPTHVGTTTSTASGSLSPYGPSPRTWGEPFETWSRVTTAHEPSPPVGRTLNLKRVSLHFRSKIACPSWWTRFSSISRPPSTARRFRYLCGPIVSILKPWQFGQLLTISRPMLAAFRLIGHDGNGKRQFTALECQVSPQCGGRRIGACPGRYCRRRRSSRWSPPVDAFSEVVHFAYRSKSLD